MKYLNICSADSTFNGLFQGIQQSKDFFFLFQHLIFYGLIIVFAKAFLFGEGRNIAIEVL